MESLYVLVQAAQRGDVESFNCIVERFQDMACASAYAMSGDRQLAEDVMQEAFLEAYLTLGKLREPASIWQLVSLHHFQAGRSSDTRQTPDEQSSRNSC